MGHSPHSSGWMRPLETGGCLDLWQKLSSENCGLWDGGLTVTLAPRHLCCRMSPSCKMDGELSLLNSREVSSLVGLNCRSLPEKGRKGGAFSGIKSSGYGVFWLMGLLNFTPSYLHQSEKGSFRLLFKQVHVILCPLLFAQAASLYY